MVDSKADKQALFRPGKADWLRKKGKKDLDSGQKALLLALVQLEAELGRELTAEESQTLEALGEQLPHTDTKQLQTALHKLVQTPTDPKRKTDWPKFKDASTEEGA